MRFHVVPGMNQNDIPIMLCFVIQTSPFQIQEHTEACFNHWHIAVDIHVHAHGLKTGYRITMRDCQSTGMHPYSATCLETGMDILSLTPLLFRLTLYETEL